MPGKQEVPHNTPAQVREYIAQALELVEVLEVPEDLRATAFAQAVGLFSSKQIIFEQAPVMNGPLMLPPRG